MSYLVLENVAKRFRREQVLEGLSLAVEQGETVSVCGPSGSGKSVLLRLIAGMVSADEGDIRLGGESIAALPPERRNVGMAFQTFALYPHLTAADNIASPLHAKRLPEADVHRRVQAVAELLRIEHVLTHVPAALSNGQKQRTALARALVSAPAVLLLDDPLRNVDAKLRYEMRIELPRVLREFESTVLYVTQDYKEAMALGHRIGVLYDGSFQQLSTPQGIYRNPVNTRVARLFGDPGINLLSARPRRDDGSGFSLELGGERVTVPLALGALEGRECVLGIRPEDVQIRREKQKNALRLELDAVTPLNLREVLLLKFRDGTEILSSTSEARDFGRGHSEVWGNINWDRAVFFDRESGAALAVD